MMKAYLDESGHESKGHVFLAGHIGTDEQWAAFEPEWKKALGNEPNLHMKKLRWDKDNTRILLARLGPIPTQCGLTRVLGGVKVSDYEDLLIGTDAEKLLKGYYNALYAVVVNILRWIPKDETLELVFEQQEEYERNVHLILLTLPPQAFLTTSDGKPKLAKWSFVPKDSTILLQQADYLAYGLLQLYRDKNSRKTQWCKPILGDFEGIGEIMKRDQIRWAVMNTEALCGGFK
jgi:uncharacterized protein DUF3800